MFFLIFKLKTGIRHTSCITARSRLFSTDLAEKQSHRIFNDKTFLAASNHFSSAVLLAFDDMKQERMTNGDISKVQKSAQSTLDLLKRGSYGSKGVDIELMSLSICSHTLSDRGIIIAKHEASNISSLSVLMLGII